MTTTIVQFHNGATVKTSKFTASALLDFDSQTSRTKTVTLQME